jgi:hypothetical protein
MFRERSFKLNSLMRAKYDQFSTLTQKKKKKKIAVFWKISCVVWYKCKEKHGKLLPSYSLMVKEFRSSNVMLVQVCQNTRHHIQVPEIFIITAVRNIHLTSTWMVDSHSIDQEILCFYGRRKIIIDVKRTITTELIKSLHILIF